MLSLVTLSSAVVAMPNVQNNEPKANIEELIVRRRWADAKYSLIEYRKGLDDVKQRYELEWVDYQLVCCCVGTP